MKRYGSFGPLLRAISVMGMVGIITTGITFAALQSQQAVLAGNTIETATAALQISTDGGSYSGSHVGFDFNNIVPGGPAVPAPYGGNPVWLKNGGTANLTLKLAVNTAPTTTGGVDLSKVFVVLTPTGGGSAQTVSIASLMASATTGGTSLSLPNLEAGATVAFKLQVSMAADAFSGGSASVSGLDLVFTGLAVTP